MRNTNALSQTKSIEDSKQSYNSRIQFRSPDQLPKKNELSIGKDQAN